MQVDSSQLKRFRLEGILGEGADMEVFAATDTETRQPLVIKRPHPSLVTRSQHGEVEARMARLRGLRGRLGEAVPWLPKLVAFAEAQPHSGFFGDDLGESYSVTVEERARGLPLVGSAVDAIKRHPIGLPLNLFVFHPLAPRAVAARRAVTSAILDAAQAVFDATGDLLLDVRPQNVFFDPRECAAFIIDIGGVEPESAATRRHGPVDLHDFYVELLRWFLSPEEPPEDPEDYALPREVPVVPEFSKTADALIEAYSGASWEPLREPAVAVIERVKDRAYSGLPAFRADFEALLALLDRRHEELRRSETRTSAWREALDHLREPYWTKFLFDPETDLAGYEAG